MGAGGLSGMERPRLPGGAFALALGALALGAVIWLALGQPETQPVGLQPHRAPAPAMSHRDAAASQQGQPTTAAEALAAIDRDLTAARMVAAAPNAGADAHAAMASLLAARARINGSFDDYVAAAKALDVAFSVAPAGAGPHLDRAELNFTMHRLAAMSPDLDAIAGYAAPDDATVTESLLLRGDVEFYSGRYRAALSFYEQAHHRMSTLGGDLRLANYYARTGNPEFAAALLDQADSRVSGPQQQLRADIEMRRGVLALSRGRLEKAEAHFRRADDIFPGYPPIELRLASVRARNGGADEAMAILNRLAARDLSPEAFDGLAALYRARGDLAEAEAWAARAGAAWDARLKQAPEAALGHALDHCLAFCDPARTLQLAQRNHALRPYGDAATELALAYLANHQPREALAAIQPTLASDWRAAEAFVVASEAYALVGEARKADAARRTALALNPRSLDRKPGMAWLEQ